MVVYAISRTQSRVCPERDSNPQALSGNGV